MVELFVTSCAVTTEIQIYGIAEKEYAVDSRITGWRIIHVSRVCG